MGGLAGFHCGRGIAGFHSGRGIVGFHCGWGMDERVYCGWGMDERFHCGWGMDERLYGRREMVGGGIHKNIGYRVYVAVYVCEPLTISTRLHYIYVSERAK